MNRAFPIGLQAPISMWWPLATAKGMEHIVREGRGGGWFRGRIAEIRDVRPGSSLQSRIEYRIGWNTAVQAEQLGQLVDPVISGRHLRDLPADVDRAQHRIASASQHPMSTYNNTRRACLSTVCGGMGPAKCASNGPKMMSTLPYHTVAPKLLAIAS